MKVRLSVTDLDKFGYYLQNESPEAFVALIEDLRGTRPATLQMDAGRAFARVFERMPHGDCGNAEADGWRFDFTVNAHVQLPPLRELKTEMTFPVDGAEVTLVGKADGTAGKVVHDQKLTERFDPEKYLDSYQWRAYLTMFGADTFVYDVFVGKYEKQRGEIVKGPIDVVDYHRLEVHSYPEMQFDLLQRVRAVLGVVQRHVPGKCRP